MKLRIRGNSIRLRVMKSEVDAIARTGSVEDAVAFGPGRSLAYRLVSDDSADVTADYTGHALIVRVPADRIAQWAATDQVAISRDQPLGGGESLRILVEKDFECLAPRPDEPAGDFFVNPAAAAGRD